MFVGSIRDGDRLASQLRKADINAQALHGELSQGRRFRMLQDFKDGEVRVLVATDLAARGIDITRLPVVVNYDLPRAPADYLHRIGRTGRAGEKGLALSFVDSAAMAHWRLICKRYDLQSATEVIEGFEPTQAAPAANVVADDNGGIKGRRPSKKDKARAAAAEKAGS